MVRAETRGSHWLHPPLDGTAKASSRLLEPAVRQEFKAGTSELLTPSLEGGRVLCAVPAKVSDDVGRRRLTRVCTSWGNKLLRHLLPGGLQTCLPPVCRVHPVDGNVLAPQWPMCNVSTHSPLPSRLPRSRAENLYLAVVDQIKPSCYTISGAPDRATAEDTLRTNLGKAADLSAEDQPISRLLPAANPRVLNYRA